MIDALGHGADARVAADLAVAACALASGASTQTLFERVHAALRGSRGAAMTLASIDGEGRLRWCGIGNVEAVLLPATAAARQYVFLSPGVVGQSLPTVRESSHALAPGDLILLATDGVGANFADDLAVVSAPAPLVERVLRRGWQGRDDALVLAARWNGLSIAT